MAANKIALIVITVLIVVLLAFVIAVIVLGVERERQKSDDANQAGQNSNVTITPVTTTPAPSANRTTGQPYLGKPVGPLSQLAHSVSGYVYVVDEYRLYIKDLTYDGTAPKAYFWIGLRNQTTSDAPNGEGEMTPDENGSVDRLARAYNKENVLLTLKKGIKVSDIRYIGLWCVQFKVNFGHIAIPENFDIPKPTILGRFTTHDGTVTSDAVTVLDHKVVLISAFSYRGNKTDVNFVGVWGSTVLLSSEVTTLPRGTDNYAPLEVNQLLDVNITIRMPPQRTIFDFDFISLFSRSSSRVYSILPIPADLNVPPSFQ